MSLRLAMTIVAGACCLCACGSSALPDGAARDLTSRVSAVRRAASSGDLETAQAELDQLERRIGRLEDGGKIDAEHADRLIAAAGDVDKQLAALGKKEEAARRAEVRALEREQREEPSVSDPSEGFDESNEDHEEEEDEEGD